MGQYAAQQGISVQNNQSIDLGRGFEYPPKCRQRSQEVYELYPAWFKAPMLQFS
jgi:hypothetical protein